MVGQLVRAPRSSHPPWVPFILPKLISFGANLGAVQPSQIINPCFSLVGAVIEPMFLSPGSRGQVAEMTGAHTRARQIRVLQQNGVRHIINAAGWPVVPISAIDGSSARSGEAQWRSSAPEWVPKPLRKSESLPTPGANLKGEWLRPYKPRKSNTPDAKKPAS